MSLAEFTNQALRQMAENANRDLPWFEPGPAHKGEFIGVGGAPSMALRTDSIKERQRAGGTVAAFNGARRFLIRRALSLTS